MGQEMKDIIERLKDEEKFCMSIPRYCNNCSIKIFDIFEDAIKEIEKLRRTMQLHAGDCCSLNTEVELFRGHWEDAEEDNKKLRKALQWWIDVNGGAPNKYEWAEQALKGRK